MTELSDKSSPLNNASIYPKYDHALYGVFTGKTKYLFIPLS
jgi:hypothetical protein